MFSGKKQAAPAHQGDHHGEKAVFSHEQDAAAREVERVIREQQEFIKGSPHRAFLSQPVDSKDPKGNDNTDGVFAAIGQVPGTTEWIKDGDDWEPWYSAWRGQRELLLWNLDHKFKEILLRAAHQVGLAQTVHPIKVPFAHGSGQAEAYDRVAAAVRAAVVHLDKALEAGPLMETV